MNYEGVLRLSIFEISTLVIQKYIIIAVSLFDRVLNSSPGSMYFIANISLTKIFAFRHHLLSCLTLSFP